MLNASQEVSSVEKKGRLMKDQQIHVCPGLRRFREVGRHSGLDCRDPCRRDRELFDYTIVRGLIK